MIASGRSSSRNPARPGTGAREDNTSSAKGTGTPGFGASAASRYDVLDRSGEGTLFVVYRVRDKSSHTLCALKALKGVYSRHEQFAAAIINAARATSTLRHPHLATMQEVGREEDTVFVVEEWLPGGTLEKRLRRAPLGRVETTSLAVYLLDGLIALHENGIAHGDIRPRQILFDASGRAKLNDIGFCAAYPASGMTLTDVQLEASYYQAPERWNGQNASTRADLYALGVVLYRAITGRVPFDGTSSLSIAMRHRNDAPLTPRQFNPACPPEFEAFILRLLQKEPAARFQSAREALAVLSPGHHPVPPQRVRPLENRITPTPGVAETQTTPQPRPDQSNAAPAVVTPVITGPNAATTPPAAVVPDVVAVSNTSTPAIETPVAATPKVSAPQVSAPKIPAAEVAVPVVAAPVAALASAGSAVTSVATGAAATSAVATTAAAGVGATRNTAAPVAKTRPVSPSSETASKAVTASKPPAASKPVAAPMAEATPETQAPSDTANVEIKKRGRREMLGAFLAFFWTLVAAGLLFGIFYGAYVFWMKEAPPEVRVPKYIGLNQTDAKVLLANSGLQMRIGKEAYNPKKPEGTILNGDPTPGKTVRRGRMILVTVSRGEEPVRIVDFSELSLEQARVIINRHGMRLGQIAEQYHERIPKGYICGQYPEPGESFRRSEPINLVVSRGPQPSSVALDPSALPVSPPAPNLPDDNGTDAPPADAAAMQSADGAPISRSAVVSVALPAGGGPQEVKIVVRDAEGEYTAYQQTHEAGDVIDKPIQVVRPQGSTALVRVYIGGRLLREIRV